MLTRVLRLAASGIALMLCLTGCGHSKKNAATTTSAKPKGPPPPTQQFVSRPDLEPPPVHVHAGHGLAGDIHEFLITRRNTALFSVYHQLPVDLSSVGGPKEGRIFDSIFQEVDIPSGRVLFEWHSWPAVGLAESYAPAPKPPKEGKKAPPYDYFHINSVELEQNGSYLISARNTHAVYEID